MLKTSIPFSLPSFSSEELARFEQEEEALNLSYANSLIAQLESDTPMSEDLQLHLISELEELTSYHSSQAANAAYIAYMVRCAMRNV